MLALVRNVPTSVKQWNKDGGDSCRRDIGLPLCVPVSYIVLYFNIEYVRRQQLRSGRDVKPHCILGAGDLTCTRAKNVTIASVQEIDRPGNAVAGAVENVRLYWAGSILHVARYALREALQWEGIECTEDVTDVCDIGIGYAYAKR